MSPLTAMLTVLRTLVETGQEVEARSVTTGAVLSSLKGDGPYWRAEAELLANGNAVLGAQDPLIRRVLLPIVRAQQILGDEDNRRRFAQARAAVERCAAEDWRAECLLWLDAEEKAAG